MTNDEIAAYLEEKGVKPTPNRILIIRELMEASRPICLAHLEESLAPMDKASIFRVLEMLAEKELVHVIDDGTRSQKYELCHGEEHHSIADQHPHFYCEHCRETYCLSDAVIPAVDVPEGFSVRAVNYVLKGTCGRCKKKTQIG